MTNRLFILLIVIFVSCDSLYTTKLSSQEKVVVNEISNQLSRFLNDDIQANKNSQLIIPKTLNENGHVVYVGIDDWSSGFYPGMLWLMYEITGEKVWKDEAIYYTNTLKSEQFNQNSEDLGLKMMCSYGNGYRVSGNPEYKNILINSARTLIRSFDEEKGCILSLKEQYNQPFKCNDELNTLMNLKILFFAHEHTGDPVFYNIAVQHAKTIMNNYNFQLSYIDELSFVNKKASVLYGLVQIYKETNNPVFLEYAEKTANQILYITDSNTTNLQGDVNASIKTNIETEVVESAILANALYKLSEVADKKKGKYRLEADRIFSSIMLDNSFMKSSFTDDFIEQNISKETSAKNNHKESQIFESYYFLEGLKETINLN